MQLFLKAANINKTIFHQRFFKYFFASVAIAFFASTIPALADSVYKVDCEGAGDFILLSSTGEAILEQRLARFIPLERDGLNTTGKRGGQRGICFIKIDTPGYKWLSCGKGNGEYVIFPRGYDYPEPIKPVKAIVNSVLYRGWSGACLIKL